MSATTPPRPQPSADVLVRRLALSAARRQRRKLGLNLSDVAARLGVSPAAVSMWERHQRNATPVRAAEYARLLHDAATSGER